MRSKLRQAVTAVLLLAVLLSFGCFSSGSAQADGFIITKVLTTISATPVALMDPALITASTSTPGCYIASAAWFDASGNIAVGAFNIETYRLEIRIAAMDGYSIDPNAACYLNNSAVTAVPDGSGKAITLVREYTAAAWAPTIYKHPGSETVNEGGWASFVVSGTYIRDYEWLLLSPNETDVVPISSLKNRFPAMESTGDGSTKLFLYNIPYELNGWKVACNFIGAGNGNVVRSQGAVLTVIPDPSRSVATPEPAAAVSEAAADAAEGGTEDPDTPEPGTEDSAVPVDGDTGAEEAEVPEAIHEHSFSPVWSYNEDTHWHECPEDGERSDEAPHEMTWVETVAATARKAGTEDGTCSVCAYHTVREIPVLEVPEASTLMNALLVLGPLDLILVILHPILFAKQRRRAQRRAARARAKAKAERISGGR